MCSDRRLIVLYFYVKFRENINITNGIRVMEQTRLHGQNGYVESKGNNSVRRQSRVMVHMLCTSSHGA